MNLSQNPSYRLGLLGLFCFCLIMMPAVLSVPLLSSVAPPLGSVAWAQDEDEEDYDEEEDYDDDDDSGGSTVTSSTPAAESPAYVEPYGVVVLCIGLGVFLVCRSANRHGLTKKWKPRGLGDDEEDEGEGQEAGPVRRTASECPEARTALIYAIVGSFCCGLLLFVAISKAGEAKRIIAQHPGMKGEGMATAAQIIAYVLLGLNLLVGLVFGVTSMMGGGE